MTNGFYSYLKLRENTIKKECKFTFCMFFLPNQFAWIQGRNCGVWVCVTSGFSERGKTLPTARSCCSWLRTSQAQRAAVMLSWDHTAAGPGAGGRQTHHISDTTMQPLGLRGTPATSSMLTHAHLNLPSRDYMYDDIFIHPALAPSS